LIKRHLHIITQTIFIFFLLFVISPSIYANENLDAIVIDAGHGGKDPGTIGDDGLKEKDLTLSIALRLGGLIQQNFPDTRIIYTRKSDVFVDVKDRTELAIYSSAKLFISVHVNHKKENETEKNGFEIYLLNQERFPEAVKITENGSYFMKSSQSLNNETDNYIFSSLTQTAFLKYGEYISHYFEFNLLNLSLLASRGIMQAGYWVLLTSMPSVLVEIGYISDPNDEKYLSSEEGKTNISIALFQGFSMYKSIYESQ
jgi:N-acetylmuramoyl-L-alanine amidase